MAETIHTEVQPLDTADDFIDLTREQLIELLEERCRRHLGMSLDEFLVEWDAGRLPDTSAVMRIAMMVGESEQ